MEDTRQREIRKERHDERETRGGRQEMRDITRGRKTQRVSEDEQDSQGRRHETRETKRKPPEESLGKKNKGCKTRKERLEVGERRAVVGPAGSRRLQQQPVPAGD